MVLSDVHLSRHYGHDVSADLARLVNKHPNAEIILAGDILDLTLDSARVPVEESINDALAPHQELLSALRGHVQAGGRLTLVPGNHDAGTSDPAHASDWRRRLGAPDDRTIEVCPWFLRRDGLHIEHGHLYDPDCAPNHPLADPNARSEGLGNALMRRFVAPNDAFIFAHKNQTTMSSGVSTAFAKWGPKAPLVIARYFGTALTLCGEAALHKGLVSQERDLGQARLSSYAASQKVTEEAARALVELAPSPTHHSFREMFLRLYFDRVFAAGSLICGATMLTSAGLGAALGAVPLLSVAGGLTAGGAILSAVGAGYLATSVSQKKNRYGDAVIGQLHSAAGQVREVTDARLVVFGHSHVEVDEPGYVNLGSFAFGRKGRPYLLVDTQGHHEKQWVRFA